MKCFPATEFGYIQTEVPLHNLHVGRAKLVPNTPPPEDPEVLIDIRYLTKERAHEIRPLFADAPRDGYFTRNGTMYYRNLNAIGSIEGGEAYYRGRLPNSYLAIKLEKTQSGFSAHIETTDSYLYENRSIFTRNEKFEHFIDNVFIILSVLANKTVMHASSVAIGDETLLFTGYPNTGKTTTSAALHRDTPGMEYIAEDMCFVDPDDLTVYSCAYTSHTNPSTLHSHGPLTRIVGLKYTPEDNTFQDGTAEECFRFIHRMNLYEYSWNQNIIIRHLLPGEGIFNQSDITMSYIAQLQELSKKVGFSVLSGNDKFGWAPLVKKHLGIAS